MRQAFHLELHIANKIRNNAVALPHSTSIVRTVHTIFNFFLIRVFVLYPEFIAGKINMHTKYSTYEYLAGPHDCDRPLSSIEADEAKRHAEAAIDMRAKTHQEPLPAAEKMAC